MSNMASSIPMIPKGVNPKLTEQFLMNLPDVVDASVWYSETGLMAHVTISGDPSLTSRKIQAQCLNELGVHQTPRELYLIWANQLVA